LHRHLRPPNMPRLPHRFLTRLPHRSPTREPHRSPTRGAFPSE
jgi:hypothetical protein